MNTNVLDTATLSFTDVLLILSIVVGGMLLAGVLVAVARAKVKGAPVSDSGSVVRSWIAISLVMGLLVFCASAFLIPDPSLRSALFGGLIANVGAAVAFYFSSKTADQARADILKATTTLAGTATAPTGFADMAPPSAVMNQAYSYRFAADGQPAPTYSVARGSVPDGLSLKLDGTLSGTPTTQGTSTFAIQVANAAGVYTSPDIAVTVS